MCLSPQAMTVCCNGSHAPIVLPTTYGRCRGKTRGASTFCVQSECVISPCATEAMKLRHVKASAASQNRPLLSCLCCCSAKHGAMIAGELGMVFLHLANLGYGAYAREIDEYYHNATAEYASMLVPTSGCYHKSPYSSGMRAWSCSASMHTICRRCDASASPTPRGIRWQAVVHDVAFSCFKHRQWCCLQLSC